MDVRLNRMDWLLDDEFDPDRGGEVKHDVAPIDQLRQERLVVHRIDEVLEAGPSFQVSDVVDRPGRQVVEDEHVVTLRQHRFRKMRADEAGPSRPGPRPTKSRRLPAMGAGVPAESRWVWAVGLPAVAQPRDPFGERAIVGDDGAAVAERAEVLRRIKTEGRPTATTMRNSA